MALAFSSLRRRTGAPSLSKRLAWLSLSLIVMAMTLAIILISQHERDRHLAASGARLQARAGLEGDLLVQQIDALRRDVLFLAHTPPVQGIVRASRNGGFDVQDNSRIDTWRSSLGQIFSAFATANPAYLQVRMIGVADRGRELVRVDLVEGRAVVSQDGHLQQKGERDYFLATLKLKAGEVYLSEINLNQERGQVQVPHLRVIRASTPVFTPDGELFGMVVINYAIGPVLDRLQAGAPLNTRVYLMNDRGDYLVHPDFGRAFGFDLGKRYRWQDDFPGLPITPATDAHAENGDVLRSANSANGLQHISLTRIHFDPRQPQRTLTLAYALPETEVVAAVAPIRILAIAGALALALILGLLFLFYRRWVLQPLGLLTEAARQIGAGRHDVPLPETAGDEVGTVVAAFRAMVDQIGQRDRELAHSSAFANSIIDNAPDGMLVVNALGCITRANALAERLFGYTAEELFGQPVEILVPEPLRAHHKLLRQSQGYKLSPTALAREVAGRHKDGHEIPLEINLASVMVGEDRNFIATITDISQRKAVEAALKESNERYDLAIKGSSDGLWDWNIATGQIYFAPRFKEMLGYRDEEMENSFAAWEIRLHPDDKAHTLAALEAHLKGEIPYDVEYRLRHKSGTYVWIRARGQVIRNAVGEPSRMAGAISDISQHKMDEAALLANEQRLRDSEKWSSNILDAVPESILVVDQTGRIVRANDQVIGMFGYTPEALCGQPVEILVPDQYRGHHAQLRTGYMSDSAPRPMGKGLELKAKRRDGSEFPVEISLTPMGDVDSKQVIVAIYDITERKTAQALIERDREQQATLREVLELSLSGNSQEEALALCLDKLLVVSWLALQPKAGIFLMDETGQALRLVVAHNLEPEIQSLCGQVALGHCHCGQAAVSGQLQYSQCIDERHGNVYPGMTDHGHYAVPLVSDAQVLGVLMLYLPTDFQRTSITDQFITSVADILAGLVSRKRNELALQQEGDLTRSIMDSLPSTIAVLDRAGTIIRVNQSWVDFAEANHAPGPVLKGVSCNYFTAATASGQADVDAEQAMVGISAVLEARLSSYYMEYPCHSPTVQRWFGMNVTPLLGAAHGGVVISHTDITRRKQAELKLLEQQEHLEELVDVRTIDLDRARLEAERLAKVKDTFLATMSHEIRTPMNALMGMLELVGLQGLNSEQARMLEVARESGKSLLRIIDDILDFSKIEAGKLVIHPEPADLAELIELTASFFRPIASSKGLRLVHSVAPEFSPALMADRMRLRQILNNFVSNAIKFTEQGEVEIRAVLVERRPGADRVSISVSDTGSGITPEVQARLFQPFSQADAETTRRYGGTGLGLAICRHLAELMDGVIELHSTPGQGTTLTLTLDLPVIPVEQLQAARETARAPGRPVTARQAPSIAEARAAGTLVLLVDDHVTNRQMLSEQLRLLGYASEQAATSTEALQMWESGSYGLLISDCHMPDMDGYQLTREIRRQEAATGRKRMPVLAWTANAMQDAVTACDAAGMDDILVKPASLSALADKLQAMLPLASVPNSPLLPSPGQAAAPAARTSGMSGVLDPGPLRELSGGNVAMESKILLRFRTANRPDAEAMARAMADHDTEAVGRLAHRMKGAARMIGARTFAHACEALEQASRADDWSRIEPAHGQFRTALARLEQILEEL